MKLRHPVEIKKVIKSPPSRGAWIEIKSRRGTALACPVAPSRGAWIEIMSLYRRRIAIAVAPLAGGVD